MTDPNDLERAERIRRLQERRAASARTANRAVATTTTGDADSPAPLRTSSTSGRTPKRARRRHPAAATRWLLGGLSVASFLAIGGTVAVANQANMTTAANQANVSTAQPAGTPPPRRPQRNGGDAGVVGDAESNDGFDDTAGRAHDDPRELSRGP